MTYDLSCTEDELVELLTAIHLLCESRGHRADKQAFRTLENKIRMGMYSTEAFGVAI